MKYAIKRNNNIIAQVEPQGNVSTKIMGEELVNMTFELPTMVKFQIGDSVNVYGANYYLLQAPVVEKVNTRHFKYSLQFGSIIYELSKIQLLFPDAENNLTVSDGNPIGNADLLIGHVLNNANRLQNGWTKGTVIETEAKQVDFSEDNCLSALAKIAEAFEVEYWIDADKSIHIVERKSDSGYSFQYGKNKGLKSITRNPMDGSNIVTRLYAVGSEKNIGSKYRNGSKRLKMDVPYLEKNTDIYNVIEHTKKFDEVYPKRIGTVTAVDANNPLIFTDSTMDFDLNERDGNGTTILIQGIPAKVTFQTGQLAGYMLEIKENGYHTATKTFTLNKNKDEKAIEVPSNLMRPKVGDKYIITDIVMPASYVTNAEAELKVKAQEYLDKNCKERLQYSVVSDPFFFRELNVNIALGNTVHFTDADLGLDANLRILSISKDLQNPYKVAFEIGEDATIISIVRAYIEKEKQQTAIIKEQKHNAAAARAAYYFGLELSEKTFDSEGYFDVTKIKPASIDTKLISLGGRMQQFSLPDVNFYLENNYTSLRNTSGRIVHLTIGDTPRTWYIASNTILNIGAVYQYVYVKCQRNGTNANILVTPNQIMVDSDPDFFHFEAGYISSIQNGFRVCKMTYGFAQINPQEISIGRWTSPVGGDYIAFSENGIEIKGKVTFASDSPALNQVQEKIDAVQVGTRNLFLKSKHRMPLATGDGSFELTADGVQFHNVTSYVAYGRGLIPDLDLGAEYTISIKYRSGIPFNNNFYWYINDLNSYKSINTVDTEGDWNIVSDTRTIVGDRIVNFHLYVPHGEVTIDWIVITKGNKGVNDWTPTPEEITNEITIANQNAANAQNTANTAAQNAIDANKKLADIANDNIVTPQEKPDTLKEWKQIEAERPKLVAQAGTYNINTDNYNNYYVALANYLTNSGVFLDMNVSTNVDGREFKNNFQNYYDVRQDLLKAISDAAKTYASGLVDNLQIGGRNLLQKSANIVMSGNDHQNSDNSVPGVITVLRSGKWNCYNWLTLPSGYDKIGKQLTMSLELLVDNQINFGVGVHFAYEQNLIRKDVSYIAPGKWTKVFITYDKITGTNTSLIGLDGIDAPVGTKIKYRNFKLEEGNKATDWTPAPEDVQEQLTNAQNSANTANQKLADIANDNLLTISEKPEVVKEWQEIDTEYPKLIQQSNSYNVDNSIYRTFYSALSAYLLAIQYDNFTIDTPINGQEFRQKFREYYDGRADLLSRITTATKNYTNQAAGELRNEARLKLLASQYTNGNCLYRDADFRSSLNGLSVYNNSSNGTVELFLWTASAANAPTKSPNMAICRYNGGGAQPYLGGFYFGTPTRANAVFVVRLIMRLDVGYHITFHSNQAGDNYSFDWATPVDGTGKWEEYIGVLRCGATGTFSSSMFFAIAGANKVIETYIAYASVFDVTDVDKYLEDRIKQNEQQTALAKAQADNALATANRVSQLTSFLNTTIDGNLVASGTMLVGDVNGGNAGITGVTDQGSNSVRIFAGANYANKNKAPLNILDNGLIKMHHPNGNKGFELGIVNGKLVFNVYDDIGNLIMEMGSQGIIFSNYIPDSWTNLKLAKFDSANYSPYDATSVTNFANTNTRQIMVNNPGGIEDAQHWNINVPKTEASHINYSTYSAGRSYDSNTYVIYEGIYFEGTLQKPQKPNGSIAKLADGWYYNIVFLSVWKKYGDPYQTGAYAYTFQLFRLSAGKVVETKDYTINGQV
ncbi:phage tail protein [Elizabethkingia anophelis]|uniref:phage tail protein n=2 Tax=Elizabethkingia anophelis TaxID=1117645 RepID=UPI00246881A7|nr:phage tail protein [Elizabethkingia anophelis]WGL71030.1 phage tail protein [Elizabethkingia anophelis]